MEEMRAVRRPTASHVAGVAERDEERRWRHHLAQTATISVAVLLLAPIAIGVLLLGVLVVVGTVAVIAVPVIIAFWGALSLALLSMAIWLIARVTFTRRAR